MPSRLAWLPALLLATLTTCSQPPPAEPQQRPNFVFLLADDLGWADLPGYGNDFHEAPHIDRLIADGMRFDQAYAAAPNCSPSRASILTGRWPARLGLTQYLPGNPALDKPLIQPELPPGLPHDEVTLAEELSAAGYATASIGKWHLGGGRYLPEGHGFDLNFAGGPNGRQRRMFAPYGIPPVQAQPGEYLTDRLVRRATNFIEQHQADPFLVFLSFYSVHEPIAGKPEWIEYFQNKPPGANHSDPVYAAMIRGLDDAVGAIRAKLSELGLDERTVIVFFSDNGGYEKFTTNKPLRSGKGWLYEGGIRDPLVVVWPAQTRPGSHSNTPVSSVDFLPTLLSIAGLEPSAQLDGTDLSPILKGTGTLEREELFWHFPHYSNSGSAPAGAIRSGSLKLLEFFEDGRKELYDLDQDPSESNDLAASRPEDVERLSRALTEWRERVNAQMPRAR